MDLLMPVVGLIVSVMLALFGIVFRRLNMLDARLREAPDREEVRQLVSDKLEPTIVLQKELKEDVKIMDHKLDKLLDRLRSNT